MPRRLLLVTWMLLPAAAVGQEAERVAARAEGLVLRLEPGQVRWSLDAERIQAQTSAPPGEVQALLVDQTPDGPGLTLVLGYNIRGHVGLAVAITGAGWSLGSRERGGAGFAAGELSWHPAELFAGVRDRAWDASLFGGAGYGVLGEQRSADGLHYQVGARAEYFVTRWLSVGGAVRYGALRFSRYVSDWDNKRSEPLPRTSGGSVLVPSLTLAVHAPVGG